MCHFLEFIRIVECLKSRTLSNLCDFERIRLVMVSKVTVGDPRYTNILMGTVRAAIAHGVLDAVRAGDIPKEKANDLGIIYSIWLDPAVPQVADLDHRALFAVHREATARVIRKAMRNEPTIEWLLENQDQVEHDFHQQGIEGNL